MKKIIVVLIFAMILGVPLQAMAAQGFSDIPASHWAYREISDLSSRGVISGYEDGSFKPDGRISRAEWAKIMVGAAELPANDFSLRYSDMRNHWALHYVNAARLYLEGYSDGTYRPDQSAIREDVTVAMVKLMDYDVSEADESLLEQFTDSDTISQDAQPYVAIAVEEGLISGFDDNTFRGQDTLTRAQAAVLLWRAFPEGSGNSAKDLPTLSDDGGSVRVNEETEYTFKPSRSGRWEFYTSENGDSDPFLILNDAYGNMITFDDDSAGGSNARIVSYLEEGITYRVKAAFYNDGTGSYTLYIAPIVASVTIPGSGGEVRVIGTKEHEFTPESSGLWMMTLSTDDYYGYPDMVLFDRHGTLISYMSWRGELPSMVAYLEAGETHYILAGTYGYGLGYGNRMSVSTLSVKPLAIEAEIPQSGGELDVTGMSYYEFTPNSSGLWTLSTSDNGSSDPYLEILDARGNYVGGDDDSGGDLNAMAIAYLEEGKVYYVCVGFWYDEENICKVTITPLELSGEIPPEGGEVRVDGTSFYEFRPNRTGPWTLMTSDNGDSDPLLILYDEFGYMIGYGDDSYEDLNARVTVFLKEGEIVYIRAGFYRSDIGSYTLSVTPPEEIPSEGGEVSVNGNTILIFTPNQSGIWEFRTSSTGENDPSIVVYDSNGYFLGYDDDSAGRYDALLPVYLEAGETYVVDIWFWNYGGSTTLKVSFGLRPTPVADFS